MYSNIRIHTGVYDTILIYVIDEQYNKYAYKLVTVHILLFKIGYYKPFQRALLGTKYFYCFICACKWIDLIVKVEL